MIKVQSVKVKIILLAMACLLLTAAVVIAYSVNFLRNRAVEDAKDQLLIIARAQAENIDAEMALALDNSSTLSQVLARVKDHDNPLDLQRYETIDLLHGILLDNPRFMGIFTCWEPKAYDYLDAGFVNEQGHDASGRFAPYWFRGDLKEVPILTPLLTSPYHSKGGIPNSWYEAVKQTHLNQIQDPIIIHHTGHDHLVTVAVSPILPDNVFVGVVGVDIDLSFLQPIADQLKIFENSATMTVVSNNGTIASSTGRPEIIMKKIADIYPETLDLQQYIRSGSEHVEISGGILYAFAPFTVGKNSNPWAVGVVVPIDKIVAAPTSLMWKQIIIFSGVMVFVFIIAAWSALKLTRPLVTIVEGMKSIRNGDFSREVTVRSRDEFGEVAMGFNLMRLKLDRTLRELQEHQEMLENRVQQRTTELNEKNLALNKANSELNHAMRAIKETQELMVQNEKLAVVGQMSGIVAHEVLNPVSAVSIRIETNIEQAQRTRSVIKKMNDIVHKTEKTIQDNIILPDDVHATIVKHFAMMDKICDSLLKNQEARLEDLFFLEKQLNRIVKIIDNLRQMSKTQKHLEPVNLTKLTNEVLDDMNDGLEKRNIVIVRDIQSVPSIRADFTDLYSIVSNLVRNAVESLEKKVKRGDRIIEVRVKRRDDNYIELTVKDNGIGISPENRQYIFEPGFTTKGRKGTGLGLSFSRNVARSYYGDIVLLDNDLEEGGIFQVLLPVKQENM